MIYYMDIDALSKKLDKINNSLKNDKSYETILYNLKDDPEVKEEYYNTFDQKEKKYQKENDEYKELISGFSDAYLGICDFYVGSELPREYEKTYLDSKEDINKMYFLFMMSIFLKS